MKRVSIPLIASNMSQYPFMGLRMSCVPNQCYISNQVDLFLNMKIRRMDRIGDVLKGWVLIIWDSVRCFVLVRLPIGRILLRCVQCACLGRIGLRARQPRAGKKCERFIPCSSEIRRLLPVREIEFSLFDLMYVGPLYLLNACPYHHQARFEIVPHFQS